MRQYFIVLAVSLLYFGIFQTKSVAPKNDESLKKCHNPQSGQEYNPAQYFKVEDCRTCLCQLNGYLACSSPEVSCDNIETVGRCFTRNGRHLKDGDAEVYHNYSSDKSNCTTCVCLGGRMECVTRDCCLYSDIEGKTQAVYSDDEVFYFNEGCNVCGCGKGGRKSCTNTSCSECAYENWDGVPGKSELGSKRVRVRERDGSKPDGYCNRYCMCVERRLSFGNGIFYPKNSLKCNEKCINFVN